MQNGSMNRHGFRKVALRVAAVGMAAMTLGGCNTLSRLAHVGEAPPMTGVENPTQQPGYRPVSMPMPAAVTASRLPNSLWRPGSRAFFKDLRANQVGDIVTVIINIDDQATVKNETSRGRTTSENMGVNALAGYETSFNKILPNAVNPANLLDYSGDTTNTGTGSINRQDKIELKVAAVVTQLLPNGNLVIHGRQETRVNYEKRELQIAGVIRPQDIDNANTVPYEKIAEARLSYGGEGQIMDVQQPRYGNQLVDIIFPF